MKRVLSLLVGLALSTPVFAQQYSSNEMRDLVQRQGQRPAFTPPKNDAIPPGDPYVAEALQTSRRHGEWVDIKLADGTPLHSWVVYPERPGKVGVVVVIHEIFGMTDWVRAVADQVAEDGFIAIAPDLLSGMGPNGGGTESLGNNVGQVIRGLSPADRATRLQAALGYGTSLAGSNGRTASVGFCWGGDTSFFLATAAPDLDGAVVFYGQAPGAAQKNIDEGLLAKIAAPVFAFYGANDTRVTPTSEPTAAAMKKLGKAYEPHIYEGAAHGFMHQRSQADYDAAVQAWPLVVRFFNQVLK